VDRGSKRKPQLTTNNSETIQGLRIIVQLEPKTAVSYKAKTDKKKEVKIAEVDKKQQPEIPIKRPKHVQDKKLKKGRTRIQKYIKERNCYDSLLNEK
jgi:hypothetical protein